MSNRRPRPLHAHAFAVANAATCACCMRGTVPMPFTCCAHCLPRAAGIGPDLNIHLLPQHFYAAAAGRSDLQGQHLIAAAGGVSQPGELLVTAAGLSQLTGELEALFGLRPVEVAHIHRSKHNVLSAYDAKLLQLLNATRTIRSEYAWLHASDKTGRAYLV